MVLGRQCLPLWLCWLTRVVILLYPRPLLNPSLVKLGVLALGIQCIPPFPFPLKLKLTCSSKGGGLVMHDHSNIQPHLQLPGISFFV